ncbi:MAG: type I-C CRISPR-associated endonuclease Cas1c [Anaerostipes faecalis]|nr:type I-C CRISPR-associated endonuclease Cas1c [Anaerostipes faecalis]
MRKLLNTLYVISSDRYLALAGENVVVLENNKTVARFPLHNLEGIVTFGYSGASPALMGACAKNGIFLCFMSRNGRFLASVAGEIKGNVVLRKQQYRFSDNEKQSVMIARNMIIGKIYNSKWVLERSTRDHPLQVDVEKIKRVTTNLNEHLKKLINVDSLEEVRGIEGNAASQYFSVIDYLILKNKEDFFLIDRNRRPPLDNVNAMLSFIYTLLANECAAALSSVGLDPYVGFLHRDRPGRVSLALDLMEELRSVFADRFVLSLINKKIVKAADFIKKENNAVLMTDEGRKKILNAWQMRKKEVIKHPFLGEKIEWGLVPYVQSLLLARYIRGDVDEYPVFMWK